MKSRADLLGRYLMQRRELGERELYLDRLTAQAATDLLVDRQASRPVALPAPEAETLDLAGVGDLDELCRLAIACERCRLAEGRRHVVFGEGDSNADVMVVGEAPGAEEDKSGRPFVGRAGKLLDLLLASVGFERDDVYICNVLKCRPPGNRNPQADEVASCSPYLRRQVELISPRAILACGTFAAQTLLETNVPISRLRGVAHSFQGVPVVATYHPAALLRNAAWVRLTWQDLQRLRVLLASA